MFKFIDLFAGVGGIRQPFDDLGGLCVFSSEIDKYARQTYQANYGEEPSGDITQILPSNIPKHDLLLAGFPCQPFSMAGKQQGFSDERGVLFFYIEKILAHHLPRVVLLENVKRFRTHDQGRTFAIIKEKLEVLGYTVFAQVLAGKDFGVPQNRERIYIVALLGSENYQFPKPSNQPTCLGDILEPNLDDKYTLSDKLWAGHQRRKTEHAQKGNGFGFGLFNAQSAYTNTCSGQPF